MIWSRGIFHVKISVEYFLLLLLIIAKEIAAVFCKNTILYCIVIEVWILIPIAKP